MKYSVVAIAAVVAALGLTGTAFAQSIPATGWQQAQVKMPQPAPDAEMRMPVPGGGGGVKGCWVNKQVLYGKYRVGFCLDRGSDGSYRVDGGGLSCRGDIDWFRNGPQVEIRMNRGRCNRNTDWSRDRITCRIDESWGEAPGVPMMQPAQARMPVPGGGGDAQVRRMDCVYKPATGPFGSQRFTAKRTD